MAAPVYVDTRTQLLATLADLSAACTEIGFGQLMANLSTLANGLSAEGLWDAEDDELLAAAQQQLQYFTQHHDPLLPNPAIGHVIASQDSALAK